MNAAQILSYVRQKGVVLIPDGDQIKYKAPFGIMTPDLAETIREHKSAIIGILTQDRKNESAPSNAQSGDNRNILPGNCEYCPAAGYWDWKGPGKWCFHYAIFLGKTGQPVHCDAAKHNCPLTRKELQNAD
jgi:hypothetical protein